MVHLKGFSPITINTYECYPFLFPKRRPTIFKTILQKKFRNGNTSNSLSPNFMNNVGSPFDKICITHMHHFFYELGSFNANKNAYCHYAKIWDSWSWHFFSPTFSHVIMSIIWLCIIIYKALMIKILNKKAW
jgi:hypothetical protein